MIDLKNVEYQINSCKQIESDNPAKAHAIYEIIERILDGDLVRMDLTRFNTSSDVVQAYLPLYNEIFSGYERLIIAKERLKKADEN